MTKQDFEKRFGCIEEYVLTYDAYLGPFVTDIVTRKNYEITEDEFTCFLNFFRKIVPRQKLNI